jgi:carotenoid cleavage dioxygenase-like enzyme
MAKAFPTDNPFLRGYYAPVNTEADAAHLHIMGELPKELCGTLYRNGPNPQFATRGLHHWFQGDGMIHAFHLENGRASYKNRWVRTPKWEMEHAEGEGMAGTFGMPQTTDPRLFALQSTTANTNIVWHAGRLLALEEAHMPFSIDPKSLMPVNGGYETYGNAIKGPFTAHPKFDPETGEMIAFGYNAKGYFTPNISIRVVDKDGTVTRDEMLDMPFPAMVHDFAVTRNWIVVPIFPLTGSMQRAMSGKPPFAWEPDKGTHIAFIPRNGTVADVKWVTAPPSYVFHPMNHFETEDGRIVVDVMKYDTAPLFPLPDGSPSSKEPAAARLFRWIFDLAGQSNTFKEVQLDDRTGEFPRFDERFCMNDYRHGWIVSGNVTEAGVRRQEGITHYDLVKGTDVTYNSGEDDRFGEPVFVPRADDAAEGDGWVLSTIYRAEEGRTDLAVFEAGDIAKGPLALVHLSSRVPAGFHGNWRPGPL